jgi:hypothetical protein
MLSGRHTSVYVTDVNGTLLPLTNGLSNVTSTLSCEPVEANPLGSQWRVRRSNGVLDWVVEVTGTGASGKREILFDLVGKKTALQVGFGGSGAIDMRYAGSAILVDYSEETAVDGVAMVTAIFVSACAGGASRQRFAGRALWDADDIQIYDADDVAIFDN